MGIMVLHQGLTIVSIIVVDHAIFVIIIIIVATAVVRAVFLVLKGDACSTSGM